MDNAEQEKNELNKNKDESIEQIKLYKKQLEKKQKLLQDERDTIHNSLTWKIISKLDKIKVKKDSKNNKKSYHERLAVDEVSQPWYGYCVYYAAFFAKKLGFDKISVIEFGVAGGSGLLNLEYHAKQVEKEIGLKIEVYGFDNGEGLPEPLDHRDYPYFWKKGDFKLDRLSLESKLQNAKLVIGDVKDTIPEFFDKYSPAPIAAMMMDLDFYSSTVEALKILEHEHEKYLPRIFCYFDDLFGTEFEVYNEFAGEWLAIKEFNDKHETKKISTRALRFT